MLEDLIAERKKKLERLKEAGIDPYPTLVPRTALSEDAIKNFEAWSSENKIISIAGRVMALRNQGQIAFLDVRDDFGKLQVVLNAKTTENCNFWLDNLDRGDFVSFTGTLFKTQRGEISLAATQVVMGSKSIRPLPTEWYGVEDEELRFRERYVELALQPETREFFRKKSIFWATVRDSMRSANFLEVETSVLEPTTGGAEAEPFATHHNALDVDFYLRISLELQLKRLIVGGYDKVFEIGRVFRNEGIDRDHLQDFTFMEFYWAYANYEDLMTFAEKMFKVLVKAVTGGSETIYAGQKINWDGDWPRVDYVTEFIKENNLDPLTATDSELRERAKKLGAEPDSADGRGRLIDLVYKKSVRPKLIQPTFLINHPVSVSPLSKRCPNRPEITERVQLVAGGAELFNGYTELNDPIDQRERFEEQARQRTAGDKEAMMLDEDFLHALEYGMPPTAGFGMSERVFSFLMDKPIRECVFFPLMRPKS